MKSFFTVCLTIVLSFALMFAVATPVFAASSPEILDNPSFEDGVTGWTSYCKATMDIYDDGAQDGTNYVTSSVKYNGVDEPRQYVTDKVAFYGKGTYHVSAYLKLAGDSSKAMARIIMQTVSSDKTVGSTTYPGQQWFVSSVAGVEINDTTWTKIEGDLKLDWSGNLEMCEFYFQIDEPAGSEDSSTDNCSLTKLDYTGAPFPTTEPDPTLAPSPTPTVAPTVKPTPTASPSAEATTASAVTTGNNNKKTPLLIAVGVATILFAGSGTALLMMSNRTKKGPIAEAEENAPPTPEVNE